MEKFDFTPLTQLSVDDVKRLEIHATRSSIRRAAAVKPMVCIPASETVPTLYYIQEVDPKTKEVSYSIHALSVDITRYLLLQGVNSAEAEAEQGVEE